MANCSIAIQILPLSATEEETLKVVDEVIQFIQTKTNAVEVSAFETTIEGEYDEMMALLQDVIKLAGDAYPNIFANVKVRYKAEGQVLTTHEKTAKYHQ